VRFGVTGHRVLPPRIIDRVRDHWSAALTADPQLRGVSCLADGADQLFAAEVLASGGALEVILPCEGYAGSLGSDDSRARFETLRRAAETVITLPYPEPSGRAYLAAGQTLVDRCDHLFAVWDGRPAHGPGGTADVVAYALARDRPVTVLWVDGVVRV
jgi:predicted nucleic acid-binding protein